MITTVYPQAYVHLGRGRYGDLLTTDLRVLLATSAYTPADTHTWLVDVNSNEVRDAPGYTPGGTPVTGRTYTLETTGRGALGCFPVTWPEAGFTCRWAIVYAATADMTTSPLISRIDFEADVTPQGLDLTLTFAALLRIGAGAP